MACTGCNGGCDDCGGLTCGTGAAGLDGLNAYTITTANFTVPAISANIGIAVSGLGQSTGLWAQDGQVIFVETAGYYQVVSSDQTSIIATNLGYTGNAVATTVISIGSGVGPAGPIGVTGAAGATGATAISVLYLETDYTANTTANNGYVIMETSTISGGTIAAVDDIIRIEMDVIGDITTANSLYDVKVEFGTNTMFLGTSMLNGALETGLRLVIDLIVTATNTVAPHVRWDKYDGSLRTSQAIFGAGGPTNSAVYFDTSAAASITLTSDADIVVSLSGNAAGDSVSMTYYKVTKLLKA